MKETLSKEELAFIHSLGKISKAEAYKMQKAADAIGKSISIKTEHILVEIYSAEKNTHK